MEQQAQHCGICSRTFIRSLGHAPYYQKMYHGTGEPRTHLRNLKPNLGYSI